MSGFALSSDLAAALAPPPELPAAEGHESDDAHDDNVNDNTFSPLLDLVERFPDLFALKVLQHLAPIDRTFLGQTGGACRAAVAASDLPHAGTREEVLEGRSVWVVTHKLREFCTSVERLAWAKASGCPWVARVCALAAQGGLLEVLRWARDNDCPWDVWTCAWAAMRRDHEMLKWAQEHGCPWVPEGSRLARHEHLQGEHRGGVQVCDGAAGGGHLEVLQWAREHHAPWDEYTCFWAAAGGHLEVLRWAREHGCPWSKWQCKKGSRKHLETLAWVRAQAP